MMSLTLADMPTFQNKKERSVWSHFAMPEKNRCQDLNSFPFVELEETTRTTSYYVDEDYPARPEIQ